MSTDPPRIDRVTTRTGDRGTTSLADGNRYPKQHPRLELLGSLDEANSALGLALVSLAGHPPSTATLHRCQSVLFEIGAIVATGKVDETRALRIAADVETLTAEAERLNEELPPLEEFLLPGGSEAAARLHLARAVVRRAERDFWRACETDRDLAASGAGIYLNRLSDYLFIAARTTSTDEALWDRE